MKDPTITITDIIELRPVSVRPNRIELTLEMSDEQKVRAIKEVVSSMSASAATALIERLHAELDS
jgi:hypothetical protein